MLKRRKNRALVVGYATIVNIAIEDLIGINEYCQEVEAHWPFLMDEEGIIKDDLDIEEYTGTKHRPMIPYAFILEPGLEIYKIYMGYHYWGRPSTHELYMDFRELTRRIRPDYKIDTSEMRENGRKVTRTRFSPMANLRKKCWPA